MTYPTASTARPTRAKLWSRNAAAERRLERHGVEWTDVVGIEAPYTLEAQVKLLEAAADRLDDARLGPDAGWEDGEAGTFTTDELIANAETDCW